MANDDWSIRKYDEAIDKQLVLDSWLQSFRASPYAGCIPNNRYFEIYGQAISELLERGSSILVAVNPADSTQILGWLCVEQTSKAEQIVHFVYVKDVFRKLGICKSLFQEAGINPRSRFYYTYRTKQARYFPLASHEPAIARRQQA